MNILLEVVTKKNVEKKPIWFMRQAGRYLPEYLKIRKNYHDFFDLCFSKQDACLVSLQPLQRFDLDAAILFSDILVIPKALGQKIEFISGKGPILGNITSLTAMHKFADKQFNNILDPVYQTISLIKNKLAKNKTLIGFAGGPWTVSCYMLEGQGSKNFDKVRRIAAKNKKNFTDLIELLVERTTQHLINQIKAGVDVIQIFDSWAGLCPEWLFNDAILEPIKKIVLRIKKHYPAIPIIYFPRCAGANYHRIAENIPLDCLSIDQFINPIDLNSTINNNITIQGGIDPMIVYAGGEMLQQEVYKYLDIYKNRSYIFNMGHGMVADMPIDNIHKTINYVREWEKKNY